MMCLVWEMNRVDPSQFLLYLDPKLGQTQWWISIN